MIQEFHYGAVSVGPSQQEGLASCVHVCVCFETWAFPAILWHTADLIHGGTPLLYPTGRCIWLAPIDNDWMLHCLRCWVKRPKVNPLFNMFNISAISWDRALQCTYNGLLPACGHILPLHLCLHFLFLLGCMDLKNVAALWLWRNETNTPEIHLNWSCFESDNLKLWTKPGKQQLKI